MFPINYPHSTLIKLLATEFRITGVHVQMTELPNYRIKKSNANLRKMAKNYNKNAKSLA